LRTSRLCRTFVVACLLLAAGTSGRPALAQSSSAPGPDIWGNLPGALVLGIPLTVAIAAYVSYRIGRREKTRAPVRREGAVSRVLSRHEDDES
jgi:hypothetical protein